MRRFLLDESGATSIEYALIAIFVSLAIIAGGTVLGASLAPVFTYSAAALTP